MLTPLPPTFATTREALHALACFAIAPARKAADGHIGLRAINGGFGTPRLPDGSVIRVRRDRLVRGDALDVPITTIRAACDALGVVPSADPGVGTDLPPFEPDAPLAVDPVATEVLGTWYALVKNVLLIVSEQLDGTTSEAQLWPEHFDLALDWGRDDVARLNLGGSPGDAFSDEPYFYAGPWQRDLLPGDPFWNAPFGAVVAYDELLSAADPVARGVALCLDAAEHLAPQR